MVKLQFPSDLLGLLQFSDFHSTNVLQEQTERFAHLPGLGGCGQTRVDPVEPAHRHHAGVDLVVELQGEDGDQHGVCSGRMDPQEGRTDGAPNRTQALTHVNEETSSSSILFSGSLLLVVLSIYRQLSVFVFVLLLLLFFDYFFSLFDTSLVFVLSYVFDLLFLDFLWYLVCLLCHPLGV